ncbi:DUF3404 domain-containing protein [Psychromonas aquimarina]|uniref:ATP-binding protein n=1 Tax=Psychromonas aquimarina TaxID=444919 RepID=UPI0004109775|nr:DUF3404 domain-containing protein [Psychromonas aquimarina]
MQVNKTNLIKSNSLKIFALCLALAACSFAVLPQADKPAGSLQSQWQQFIELASKLPLQTQIKLDKLSLFPVTLLKSDSSYPNFSNYTWEQIIFIHQVQKSCVLKESPQHSDNNFSRAIEFELSLCQGALLNNNWFNKGEKIHPAGGSYADRYLAFLNKTTSREAEKFLASFKGALTLANPLHPLYNDFSGLTAKGSDALLSGYHSYLAQDGRLWLNSQTGISAIEEKQWSALADRLALQISTIPANGETGKSCAYRYSNLCIEQLDNRVQWSSILIVLLGLSILFIAVKSALERREEAKERYFILQLLTHELRTPVSSLGFTVEQFRNQYDYLNKDTQLTFGRLLADYQRLAQLTETSKGFLSANPGERFQYQTAYLSEWLEHLLKKHKLDYQLADDAQLTLPFYWLGICLDNLLRNALQHGKGAVSVTAAVNKKLTIEVQNQGNFPSFWQRRVIQFTQSNKKSSGNMGIGLTIVARLMNKMGGRLICSRNPTRFTLELPL